MKTDAEVDTLLSQQYKVSGYPTCVLVDRDGNEIDRIIGFMPTEDFLETVANYQLGIGTLGDLLQRAETETDRDLYFQIADKYKYRGAPEEAETWFAKVIESGDPLDSLAANSRMAMADLYRRAKEMDKAKATYEAIAADFAGTEFEADALMYVGHVYRWTDDFAGAVAHYESLMKRYDGEETSEVAEIYRAISFRDAPDTAAAITAFTDFTLHHPQSEDVEYANKQIAKLKGEVASE